MSRRNAGRLATLAALIGGVFAGAASARDDEEKAGRPIDRMVGERVANFALTDVATGKRVALYGFYGKKAVVLVFTGVDCPVGNLYMPRLVELNEKYKDQGVVFLAINANASETDEQLQAHAKEYGLAFPVLKDKTGRVAQQLEAERTCEVLVLDGVAKLRYRGAIDDQYGYGTRKDEPTKHHLAEALDALLAGKPVETTATTVVGCPIEKVEQKPSSAARVRPAPDEVVDALNELDPPVDPDSIGPVNYAEHVAPILQNRCQSCHRPNEVGPFTLLSYADAKRRAAGIAEVVEDLRMPPWHADPRFGHFANDRRLSARERATLLAWVEQGAPEGDPEKEPEARAWSEGWSIGTPDVVFQMPKPYTVKPDGALPYQRFRVKTGFTEPRWVQAIEPRPGNRAVVHHVIVYLIQKDDQGKVSDMEHLAAYAPGDLPSRFPEGSAKLIPADAELVFELHYTPIGKVAVDQTSVGMIFAKEPPKYRVITQAIPNMKFKIPPGAGNEEVASKYDFPRDAQILGFLPHMHLRGKDFKYTATYPDGRAEVLLSVPQYDFNWQSYYWLAEPKAMPKGTVIDCLAHFDNSENNRALTKADTEEEVRWGEQTWEEMMIGYIDYLVPAEAEPAKAASARPARSGSSFGRVLRALATRRPSPSGERHASVATSPADPR